MKYHSLKINHETPFEMMEEVQKLTDYDYGLVHLYDTNPAYKQYFIDARKAGRDVLLDNSVFELEEPFNPDKFVDAINETDPTWYIVPDFLDNKTLTIESMQTWIRDYLPKIKTDSKIIGSIQGATLKDFRDCYIWMSECPEVSKIAITFNSLAYADICKDIPAAVKGEEFKPTELNLLRWMEGRQRFIALLVAEGLWNSDKPHHLLGCGYLREFQYPLYHRISVESLDTSNPTIYGLNELWYDRDVGNTTKPSMKLCDHLNDKLTNMQKTIIKSNVSVFRSIVNGKFEEK